MRPRRPRCTPVLRPRPGRLPLPVRRHCRCGPLVPALRPGLPPRRAASLAAVAAPGPTVGGGIGMRSSPPTARSPTARIWLAEPVVPLDADARGRPGRGLVVVLLAGKLLLRGDVGIRQYLEGMAGRHQADRAVGAPGPRRARPRPPPPRSTRPAGRPPTARRGSADRCAPTGRSGRWQAAPRPAPAPPTAHAAAV